MDNASVREKRDFMNLAAEQPRMHLLDEPCSFVSSLAKSDLVCQMRFSVKRLEEELAAE